MAISNRQKKINLNAQLLGNLPDGYVEDYIRLFLVENADGTYSVKPVSLGTDAMKQMEQKYGDIIKTQYPKARSPGEFLKIRIREVNSAITQDLKSKNLIINSLTKSDLKRGKRLDKTAKKMRYYKGTNDFPFHHIMPIGGETRITTNDVAIITKKMNSQLSPYNRQLNDIADEISDNISKAYKTRSEGGSFPYLKKVDELNNKAEQVIARVAEKLPKKFQPYIGFTQLNAVTDEYGLPIDDQPIIENRIGKVGEKGIPIDDLNKTQLSGAKSSIDNLTKNKTIGKLDFKNLLVQEATVPGSPICNLPSVVKRNADGGRIAFANGSNCAIEVGEAFDKNPKGFAQEVNKIPEETGAFNKVKNAASKFLNVAKKGGRFGAFAAVGATAGAVKQFMSDDPTSYLSDENQQKNMLIDMVTEPVMDERDPGITSSAQLPVLGAVTAAGAIPGGAEYYKDRRGIRPNDKFTGPMQKGVGKIRAAASPFPRTPDKGPRAALTGLTLFLRILAPSASKRGPPNGLFMLPAPVLCLYNSAPPGTIPAAVTAPIAGSGASPNAVLGCSNGVDTGCVNISINIFFC